MALVSCAAIVLKSELPPADSADPAAGATAAAADAAPAAASASASRVQMYAASLQANCATFAALSRPSVASSHLLKRNTPGGVRNVQSAAPPAPDAADGDDAAAAAGGPVRLICMTTDMPDAQNT